MSRLDTRPGARVTVYALALLVTPILHGLCFPPASLHWVAWVCFVPWFVALRLANLGTALCISSVTTLLGSYFCARWLPTAVANYYAQPLVIGVIVFVGVWAVTVAPWVLAFTVCYRALARRAGPTLPLLAGAAWSGAELARARLFIGDPFGLFGYSQVPFAPMVQIADVTGVYGISFVLAAVNLALAELCLAVGWQRRATRGAIAGLSLTAAVVLMVAGYGFVRLHPPADFQPVGPPTPVAIVQGNLDLGSQWSSEFYGLNLDTYLRLTLEALGHSQPALVFWPESAMTFFLEDEAPYQGAIGHVLAASHVQLVAGGPRKADSPQPLYTNTAFLIAPEGHILATYDKQRLLPFAEYFPFAGLDLLRRQFARVREFTPGGPATLLPTVAGSAGVVICNEVMFGEIVAARVRAGATYIVNLANDTWLGDPRYAAQVFDMARLRAVEQRRYLVRASTSGPSAIVDPFGGVVVRTAPESRATIGGVIQAGGGTTVYGRIGDLFGVLCIAAALGAAVRAGMRSSLVNSG